MSPDSKTSTSDFIKEHVEGCLKAIAIGDIQAVSMVQIKEECTTPEQIRCLSYLEHHPELGCEAIEKGTF